jgi:D-xylose transport system permease protein
MNSRLTFRDFSMFIALALVCGFFAMMAPQFTSARNLSLLMIEVATIGVLAMGMLLIILPGHIDLSAGSGVGLCGGLAAVLVFRHEVSAPVAMGAGIALGVIVWTLMGAFIVKEKMPAFIVTLGGMLMLKGAFWQVIRNATVPVTADGGSNLFSALTTYYLPNSLGFALAAVLVAGSAWAAQRSRQQRRAHGFAVENGEISFLTQFVVAQAILLFVLVTNQYRGVPLPAVILATVTVAVHILTSHTRFGRHLYAVGGNEEAAIVSGVPVARTVIIAFAIMGAIVGLTGLMQTAYGGSSTTTIGELMELDAIAACVIGGVSLRGGRGNVMGVLFGVLIIGCLINGMTLMALDPWTKLEVRGAVLILAVWLDTRMAK